MAFKRNRTSSSVFETPYDLFKSLSGRKFADLMLHQEEILKTYLESGLNKSDVAMQLPTGSGKTLVGVLIAEWRRRKFGEKVVYLCPTIQLVNQTCKQAKDDHRINMVAFTGAKKNFTAKDITAYETGKSVAVTTFSAIFNAKSFFKDADIIIVDDAHASENYVAKTWSVEIDVHNEKHKPLHDALVACLKPVISILDYARLSGRWTNHSDASWYDKLPTPKLFEVKDDLIKVMNAHIYKTDQKFPWLMIMDHLEACQIYLSSNTILIRPLIPPTWTLEAFSNPKQRIFMSATLGNGGDLERLTGRKKIYRLPTPEDFKKQGIGRKFFVFPEMTMTPDEADKLRLDLLQKAGRGVIITPSGKECSRIAAAVQSRIGEKNVLSVGDIENSKNDFLLKDDAAVVMANRYDGVDFPNDECRYLCVDGLPRAMNAQENFFMSRMGARVLFSERIQTRVMQAVGRCTRSLQDYSAVFVTGRELQNQLTNRSRIQHFPSELQAELNFGIETSMEAEKKDHHENFDLFIEHSDEWQEVNAEIIQDIEKYDQKPFPALDSLENIVGYEIDYQKAIWQHDYKEAFEAAKKVSSGLLNGSELKGYRGLWYYLGGSAAFLAHNAGQISQMAAVREQFTAAKKASNLISWLSDLSNIGLVDDTDEAGQDDADLNTQIDNLESILLSFGSKHDARYEKYEAEILNGLTDMEHFEDAYEQLGKLLGFYSGNIEVHGSPDPYWISKSRCFVFEDHANAGEDKVLSVTKARQVSSHPAWMEENIEIAQGLEKFAVLVTPVSKVDKGGMPSLKSVALWKLDDFIIWAKEALSQIRSLRVDLTEAALA